MGLHANKMDANMIVNAGSIHHRRPGRGLATLELVLALPILLCVMALMINFGTVASWKVRALGVARYCVWGNRSPRSTAPFPRPTYWPPSASLGTGGLPPAPDLDGPRVTAPPLGPIGNVIPNTDNPSTDVMNPTLELRRGSAHAARQYPMLRSLGQYSLNAHTELLDNTWDFRRMGLWGNTDFRIPLVYTLAPVAAQQAWAAVYNAARQAIITMLFPSGMNVRGPLWPLDRDDEFIYYSQLFGWGSGAPDFHPRLAGFCSLDRKLADDRVNDLVNHIQGKKDQRNHIADVAETMTRAFINLYERSIQAYRRLMNATPPPPPGQLANMQAQINQLQQKIDTLNQFLQTLQ
jgi:hypothetical protein